MKKVPLIILTGPTAVGKTSIGVQIAHKFGGEIISADSRQTYKGLDIGSGKDFENKNYYYVVFNNANGKYLVKLDCNETFIKSLINYSNKLLVEKDF